MWRPLGAPSRCETAALARVRRRRCATSWQLVWRSLNSRARSPWPPSQARMRPSFNVTGQSERLLSNQNTVINLISTFAKININQSAENQNECDHKAAIRHTTSHHARRRNSTSFLPQPVISADVTLTHFPSDRFLLRANMNSALANCA